MMGENGLNMKFSVLMSVYNKENPEYLDIALESTLVNQTVKPDEVIIVKDGPLTVKLEAIIEQYIYKFPHKIKIVTLSENKGLGTALNEGLKHCSNELVARVDTDDINCIDRFEKQLNIFNNNDNIDIVGGYISEFDKDHTIFTNIKKMPEIHKNIVKMSKHRNPMNHMTVMFKKSSVENSGGYKHIFYLEDYYLWIRMISNNYKFYNIQEILVYARTGSDMVKRRGNKKYIIGWFKIQKLMFKLKYINLLDFIVNMVCIIGFVFIPTSIRKKIYKYILRKNGTSNSLDNHIASNI